MSLSFELVERDVSRLRLGSWRGRSLGYDVSVYLIDGVLVDTGPPLARRTLLDAVEAWRPRGAIVTHWHEDHAGNVPALATLGVPLAMSAGCETVLRERPPIRLYRRAIWGWTPPLTQRVVPFDTGALALVETPGHSPDHLAVWDPERRILASGDLFLGVQVRVAHAHESPRALLASLRRAAALEPRILLDAHRGVIPMATTMLLAKIDWTEDTVGRIEALAAEGVTDGEIVRRLFGGESFVGRASGGEYSRASFVRAVRRERLAPG